MPGKPGSQARPRLCVEPYPIRLGKLPDEGHERGVGQAAPLTAKVCGIAQPRLDRHQQIGAGGAVSGGVRVVPVGVFVAIQMMFERAVILRDERFVRPIEPAFGDRSAPVPSA
jgi:hypothetical protein